MNLTYIFAEAAECAKWYDKGNEKYFGANFGCNFGGAAGRA